MSTLSPQGYQCSASRHACTYSFSVRSMLAWVRHRLLDGNSPSIAVLSECFFQVQSLLIVLHNLVPGLTWSSPFCSTINHQTSTFANPVLSFHLFWSNHLCRICRITTETSCVLSQSRISSDGLRSDRLVPHIHLAVCISVRVFYLNRPCFAAI